MGRGTRWIVTTVGKEIAYGLAAPIANIGADAAAGVLGAWDLATDANAAQRRVRAGVAGLHRTNGQSSRSRQADPATAITAMGGEWFHGGGDRTNALAQIGLDFVAFRNEITSAHLSDADQLWVANEVAPALAEWTNFVERMANATIAPYVLEWSVFQSWWQRLHVLRQLARARGIVLSSPEPQPLPETVWERGAHGTGGQLDTAISLAKTAVFGIIAISGLLGFYAVARDLHGKATT